MYKFKLIFHHRLLIFIHQFQTRNGMNVVISFGIFFSYKDGHLAEVSINQIFELHNIVILKNKLTHGMYLKRLVGEGDLGIR